LIYTTTAGWIITKKGEVLLKQTVDEHTKIICYEPIKGKVPADEFAPNACRRIIREALNRALSGRSLLLTRLTIPNKEIKEDFTFGDRENKGVRWHFFYTITPEWVLNFLPSPKFKLLKKEDWEKIRKFTKVKREPPKNLEQKITLYDFDYEVLINRIWEIQKVLAPIYGE